jgi:hypothetical protein
MGLGYQRRMEVDVPEGECRGMRVERFTITEEDLNGLTAFKHRLQGRGIQPGTYTKLVDRSTFWMSDTPAERRDHCEVIGAIDLGKAKRVLIGGLGIGMVVQAALTFDHVELIQVVERDERVIELVADHYLKSGRVEIIHADAVEQMKAWPRGSRWDVVYHDIWPEISADNLPEMRAFSAFYRRRAGHVLNWAQPRCTRQARQVAAEERRYRVFFS